MYIFLTKLTRYQSQTEVIKHKLSGSDEGDDDCLAVLLLWQSGA